MRKIVQILRNNNEHVWEVSDFVAVFNQTIEYAYPIVVIAGEIASLKISKNRWVYFDLKDDDASLRCFGSVYQISTPLENGMTVKLVGSPRLHEQFGFSITFRSVLPSGEGSIKKAADLLVQKLEKEGLFDVSRKRPLPYAPASVGLITSRESAAYRDFVKIMNERWCGTRVELYDVQVQGEAAVTQVVGAIEYFNSHDAPVDVLIVTRGGGSPDDLAAFSTEQITRAIALSRIPTMVAIGHEIDDSLAERAADARASTPSNAAQLIFPDKHQLHASLRTLQETLLQRVQSQLLRQFEVLQSERENVAHKYRKIISDYRYQLEKRGQMLELLHPENALKRGYALIRSNGSVVKHVHQLDVGKAVTISLVDGVVDAVVKNVTRNKRV